MNPAVWLVIWLGSTAVACLITAWAAYLAGFDHGHDEGADRERGRHRAAAPPELPRAGRLEITPEPGLFRAGGVLPDPFPGWEFFGGAQVEPQPGPAEYELMTRTAQTAEQPEADPMPGQLPLWPDKDDPDDETPSAFTRRMADEVEKMIAGWEAQGNYDRHLIQAEHLTRN
jgi:hypothetical protein